MPLWGESGIIETAQLSVWLASALIALSVSLLTRDPQRRAPLLALGVLALVAAAREYDLHIYLNPETLGQYGVRYRIDWLLDGSVPFWLKAGWITIFATVGVILYAVVRRAGPQFKQMFAARTPAALMLIGAVVFILIGYALDDLMRGIFSGQRGPFEESAELMAALLYLGAVITLAAAKTPASTRA